LRSGWCRLSPVFLLRFSGAKLAQPSLGPVEKWVIETKRKLRKRVMVCVAAIGSLLCLAAAATGTNNEVYIWTAVGWVPATDDQATMSPEGEDSQQSRFSSSASPGSPVYVPPEPGNPSQFLIRNTVTVHPCGDVNPLIAGQDFDNPAGKVFIWNNDENLYVKLQVYSPWYMTETAVNVDTAPPSPPINPGHFTSKHPSPDNPEDLHTISLSSLSFPVEPGDLVYIMAHAVVDNLDTGASETAWKEGTKIEGPGAGWAMYHQYLIR